jgi:hypothetical protein
MASISNGARLHGAAVQAGFALTLVMVWSSLSSYTSRVRSECFATASRIQLESVLPFDGIVNVANIIRESDAALNLSQYAFLHFTDLLSGVRRARAHHPDGSQCLVLNSGILSYCHEDGTGCKGARCVPRPLVARVRVRGCCLPACPCFAFAACGERKSDVGVWGAVR